MEKTTDLDRLRLLDSSAPIDSILNSAFAPQKSDLEIDPSKLLLDPSAPIDNLLNDAFGIKNKSSAAPVSGDRYKWFFRVKISGTAGVASNEAVAPASDAEGLKSALLDLNAPIEQIIDQALVQYKKNPLMQQGDGFHQPLLLDPKAKTEDLLKQVLQKPLPNPVGVKPASSFSNSLLIDPSAPIDRILAEVVSGRKPEEQQLLLDPNAPIGDLLKAALGVALKEGEPPAQEGAGELIFDSAQGDILGTPFIRLSTYQHATAKFVINDPDDSIRQQLAKHSKVEIEAGFVNGFSLNKFVGVLYTVGKQFPSGTVVEAVDTAYRMQQAGEAVLPTQGTQPETTVSTDAGEEKVTGTFEGEASFYGGGDGFDGKKTASGQVFDSSKLTAAHKTLPFGTRVRVTNAANGKSVVVTITDRGPYAGGRVLDLSKAAAQAIGMVASGHAKVKAEILAPKSEGKKPSAPDKSKTQMDRDKPLAPSAKYQVEKSSVETAEAKPTTSSKNPVAKQVSSALIQVGNQNPKEQIADAKKLTGTADLKFKDRSPMKIPGAGNVQAQGSAMQQTKNQAALQGDAIVARGNTVSQVAPGEGTDSGLILDYESNRAAFIDVNVVKRMGVQLQSGYGAYTVRGWNPNDKQVVEATAVQPGPVLQHPTGVIQAPDWGKIKISDPIIPGSLYTWGDATKNGSRVPTSKLIMQNIVKICPYLDKFTKEVGKGKWTITSWYRDPVSNRKAGGVADSQHLTGNAVDVAFPGMYQWHDKMYHPWIGGLAKSSGRKGNFVHIDLGPKRWWNY